VYSDPRGLPETANHPIGKTDSAKKHVTKFNVSNVETYEKVYLEPSLSVHRSSLRSAASGLACTLTAAVLSCTDQSYLLSRRVRCRATSNRPRSLWTWPTRRYAAAHTSVPVVPFPVILRPDCESGAVVESVWWL
jgi:hypothetical protein